jgi:hypothetical protein
VKLELGEDIWGSWAGGSGRSIPKGMLNFDSDGREVDGLDWLCDIQYILGSELYVGDSGV